MSSVLAPVHLAGVAPLGLLPPTGAAGSGGAAAAGGGGFASLLQAALGGVNQDQVAAQAAERSLASGQVADVGQVVVAAEQARLSLDLTIAIRNKLLEAYQEVMRMPM